MREIAVCWSAASLSSLGSVEPARAEAALATLALERGAGTFSGRWPLRRSGSCASCSVMSIAPRTFQRAYIRFRPPTAAETLAAQS
jgi:hypothetical protein